MENRNSQQNKTKPDYLTHIEKDDEKNQNYLRQVEFMFPWTIKESNKKTVRKCYIDLIIKKN